jgi:hypothetical protein
VDPCQDVPIIVCPLTSSGESQDPPGLRSLGTARCYDQPVIDCWARKLIARAGAGGVEAERRGSGTSRRNIHRHTDTEMSKLARELESRRSCCLVGPTGRWNTQRSIALQTLDSQGSAVSRALPGTSTEQGRRSCAAPFDGSTVVFPKAPSAGGQGRCSGRAERQSEHQGPDGDWRAEGELRQDSGRSDKPEGNHDREGG